MHESEDMVGESGCIGIVLFDSQVGLMVKKPVKHIGRVADADVDDLGVEGRVLVGDMGVEELAGFGAVLQVDVACAFSSSSSLEALPI